MKSINIIETQKKRINKKQVNMENTLKNFIKQYRDPNRLAKSFPSFKKRVKKITNIEAIPEIPSALSQNLKEDGYVIVKWYSTLDGRTKSFYDDGKPFPKISEMQILSQVETMISLNKTRVVNNVWVLKMI